MSNRGFTLVELLAVIALLAIISTIAVTSFSNIKNSIYERNYDNNLELIRAGALEYYEETGYNTFLVQTLLQKGYLKDNYGSSFYINKENYDCYAVLVVDKLNSDGALETVFSLGDNYPGEQLGTCEDILTTDAFNILNNGNRTISVNIPENSFVVVTSNIGHYYRFTTSSVIDLSNVTYRKPFSFKAVLVDENENIYRKTIEVVL